MFAATSTTTAANATRFAVPGTTTSAITGVTSLGTENVWRVGQISRQAAKQVQRRSLIIQFALKKKKKGL